MFVFISTLAGFFGFAAAGFVFGVIVGSGPQQSHALSATIVGGLFALYFSPVGFFTALAGALVMKQKSAKRIVAVLAITFVVTAGASLAYIYFNTARKV